MLVKKYETQEEWLEDRYGKISGSKLKDVVVLRGNSRKIGFYQLVADRLAVIEAPMDARERGHLLEADAIAELEKATGLKLNNNVENEKSHIMWVSDENPNMAYSPDGYTDDFKITAEAKCLSSARHCEIFIEDKIPSDFVPQMLQSFIVNEKQELHYFVSYDPRVTVKPVHIIVTKREDVENEIKFYKEYEEQVLAEVDEIVERLTF